MAPARLAVQSASTFPFLNFDIVPGIFALATTKPPSMSSIRAPVAYKLLFWRSTVVVQGRMLWLVFAGAVEGARWEHGDSRQDNPIWVADVVLTKAYYRSGHTCQTSQQRSGKWAFPFLNAPFASATIGDSSPITSDNFFPGKEDSGGEESDWYDSNTDESGGEDSDGHFFAEQELLTS
ncbi:hypothetical protein CERZMDRAFT_87864 [Cercospora zeae-maydis SCOH1-5]|uniref:Uncharacterized protein n=1 Tax=Cercospora zeae-maydis SCOH1-5 TaxID=717836 RepID=A0A6A6F4F0_9PEZI|nr:hypothetical protein CERZMDRAFT_87864 [Cercospora zeae-maydis SCOH1-5]